MAGSPHGRGGEVMSAGTLETEFFLWGSVVAKVVSAGVWSGGSSPLSSASFLYGFFSRERPTACGWAEDSKRGGGNCCDIDLEAECAGVKLGDALVTQAPAPLSCVNLYPPGSDSTGLMMLPNRFF